MINSTKRIWALSSEKEVIWMNDLLNLLFAITLYYSYFNSSLKVILVVVRC